ARLVTRGELDLDVVAHLELVQAAFFLVAFGRSLVLALPGMTRLLAALANLGLRRQPHDVDIVPPAARLAVFLIPARGVPAFGLTLLGLHGRPDDRQEGPFRLDAAVPAIL